MAKHVSARPAKRHGGRGDARVTHPSTWPGQPRPRYPFKRSNRDQRSCGLTVAGQYRGVKGYNGRTLVPLKAIDTSRSTDRRHERTSARHAGRSTPGEQEVVIVGLTNRASRGNTGLELPPRRRVASNIVSRHTGKGRLDRLGLPGSRRRWLSTGLRNVGA